jgi:hypothetical protein
MSAPSYAERIERLIEALPPRDGHRFHWCEWTGELISAMQDAGASTKDIFEIFLWEAGVIVGQGRALSLDEAKEGIEQFSSACAELVGPPEKRWPWRDDLN